MLSYYLFKHSFFFNKYFLSSYWIQGIVGKDCYICFTDQFWISDLARRCPSLNSGPLDFRFTDLTDTSYAGSPELCFRFPSSRIRLSSHSIKPWIWVLRSKHIARCWIFHFLTLCPFWLFHVHAMLVGKCLPIIWYDPVTFETTLSFFIIVVFFNEKKKPTLNSGKIHIKFTVWTVFYTWS